MAAATVALSLLLGVATMAVYRTPAVATQEAALTTLDGEAVFRTKGCMMCHIGPGVGGGISVGPDLSTLVERAADRVEGLSAVEYVRQSVLDPQAFVAPGFESAQMPTLPLSTAEVDALIEFLLSS